MLLLECSKVQKHYQMAKDEYIQKNPLKAKPLLEAFLKQYPDGVYADSAHVMLDECNAFLSALDDYKNDDSLASAYRQFSNFLAKYDSTSALYYTAKAYKDTLEMIDFLKQRLAKLLENEEDYYEEIAKLYSSLGDFRPSLYNTDSLSAVYTQKANDKRRRRKKFLDAFINLDNALFEFYSSLSQPSLDISLIYLKSKKAQRVNSRITQYYKQALKYSSEVNGVSGQLKNLYKYHNDVLDVMRTYKKKNISMRDFMTHLAYQATIVQIVEKMEESRKTIIMLILNSRIKEMYLELQNLEKNRL